MTDTGASARLQLIGPFRLTDSHGRRIDISSRKGQALLALVAMAGNGERTRSWLQGQLWGSRAPEQARASLRSELSGLRTSLNGSAELVLFSDNSRVWIDLARLEVDARDTARDMAPDGEFLEGLDIPGEETFEDWLREQRARLETDRQRPMQPPAMRARSTANGVTAREPTDVNKSPAEFISQPAIAVLPFANQTGDAALDFLVEGVSEDLIDRLARLRWLPVISRGSSFALRGSNDDTRAIGAALGARYVVEGRLRGSGKQRQLHVSLADSQSGQAIWSNRVPVNDLGEAASLDDLLTGLASSLGSRIDHEEQLRALRKPQSDLNVRDLIWRGRWHLNRMTREDSRAAKACFAQALEQEPNSPEAIIQSIWARVWDLWANRGNDEQIREMRQMAQKAIIADCDDARGHMLAGIAEIWLRQPMRAEALLGRAIELNPSLVMAHVQLGSALRLRDEPGQAIEALNIAVRLSPNDHDMFFIACELAASCLMTGDYQAALSHAEQSLSRRGAYWFAYVVKINALVRMDRLADARAAVRDLGDACPQFEPGHIDWQPFIDPANNIFLKDGLNQAAV